MSASAARSSSRERPVRFWGSFGVVSRIVSTSWMMFRRAFSESGSCAILPSCSGNAMESNSLKNLANATFGHYRRSASPHASTGRTDGVF